MLLAHMQALCRIRDTGKCHRASILPRLELRIARWFNLMRVVGMSIGTAGVIMTVTQSVWSRRMHHPALARIVLPRPTRRLSKFVIYFADYSSSGRSEMNEASSDELVAVWGSGTPTCVPRHGDVFVALRAACRRVVLVGN